MPSDSFIPSKSNGSKQTNGRRRAPSTDTQGHLKSGRAAFWQAADCPACSLWGGLPTQPHATCPPPAPRPPPKHNGPPQANLPTNTDPRTLPCRTVGCASVTSRNFFESMATMSLSVRAWICLEVWSVNGPRLAADEMSCAGGRLPETPQTITHSSGIYAYRAS